MCANPCQHRPLADANSGTDVNFDQRQSEHWTRMPTPPVTQAREHLLSSVKLHHCCCLIMHATVWKYISSTSFLRCLRGIDDTAAALSWSSYALLGGKPINLCLSSFSSVVADTCVAMDEWVQHPREHTALDDILPCVDASTANESLYRSKEVSFQLVKVVNEYIANISNGNFPSFIPAYYNQSGPLVPVLCNPFASDLTDRQCADGEVHFSNASQVWEGYLCNVSTTSGREICNTVGRITPSTYKQMTAAANISYGSYHYGPFLAELQDCTFVRDTFAAISSQDCPGLRLHSKWIYIGLVMVSGAVMLSLIFWVIYTRERRHRKYNKQFLVGSSQVPPVQEKGYRAELEPDDVHSRTYKPELLVAIGSRCRSLDKRKRKYSVAEVASTFNQKGV
ncbi:hypothetical protein Taro_053859 [Colocasia esculenta]|uniref:Uncharacterized protein n=1 Tax=Colocasia esculenta TaxID=4460 RepID=A0A843XNV7_COLES|nr:hypothetical protein [Colocasia esculenta]